MDKEILHIGISSGSMDKLTLSKRYGLPSSQQKVKVFVDCALQPAGLGVKCGGQECPPLITTYCCSGRGVLKEIRSILSGGPDIRILSDVLGSLFIESVGSRTDNVCRSLPSMCKCGGHKEIGCKVRSV